MSMPFQQISLVDLNHLCINISHLIRMVYLLCRDVILVFIISVLLLSMVICKAMLVCCLKYFASVFILVCSTSSVAFRSYFDEMKGVGEKTNETKHSQASFSLVMGLSTLLL